MEKFIKWLGIIFNISGVVSAFSKEYILAVILVILGFVSIIAASIESVIKTKEKTKQIEKEENGKTERAKIAEEGRTERARISATESAQQLKSLGNIYKSISASMPPEELQKLNNSNVTFYSEFMRNRLKDSMSKNHIENEMSYYEDGQNENNKSFSKKDDSESDNNKLLELGEKLLEQFVKSKRDGNNGN